MLLIITMLLAKSMVFSGCMLIQRLYSGHFNGDDIGQLNERQKNTLLLIGGCFDSNS
ncbi:hypothetical protein S96127_1895 [Yersinia pestis]|nr:hypothetical protein S96127_1895 [Yersinia pestis]